MILVELVNALEAAGEGTVGTDLFVGLWPAARTTGVMLIQTGGQADQDLLEIRRTRFNAVVRANTFPAGHIKAELIRTALVQRQVQLGAYWVYQCLPYNEAQLLGREESGVFTFVINFEVVWRDA